MQKLGHAAKVVPYLALTLNSWIFTINNWFVKYFPCKIVCKSSICPNFHAITPPSFVMLFPAYFDFNIVTKCILSATKSLFFFLLVTWLDSGTFTRPCARAWVCRRVWCKKEITQHPKPLAVTPSFPMLLSPRLHQLSLSASLFLLLLTVGGDKSQREGHTRSVQPLFSLHAWPVISSLGPCNSLSWEPCCCCGQAWHIESNFLSWSHCIMECSRA